MKKTIAWSLSLGLLLLATPMWAKPSTPSNAGQRGPGGPDGRGPGGPGRRMRGPKMGLERLWRGVGELQGANAVTKDQARRMVALVRPWSSKPSMSDADATALTAKLSAVLTSGQKSALSQMRPGPRDGRGPGGPPGGRDGGRDGERGRDGDGRRGPGGPPPGGFGGGPGGPPSGFDRSKMDAMRTQMDTLRKTMNPFYPPSKYAQAKDLPDFMREGMTRRYEESRATLSALARKAS